MEATPPLDQVSSQAVSRLAAERGLAAAVSPAGEETVRKPGRGWKRWLPYLFFGLSLFALGSMALGFSALADDGWSWTDAVELALMVILVVGVVSQARTMLRPTRAGRWLAARRRSVPETSNPSRPHTSYALDAVSAEYLSAIGPANAAAMRRGTALKHAGSRWFDRAAVVTVVALATLAFLGMLFVLGWIVYTAGPSDPSLWLTAPFTGLSGFATWQLFGSARMMSFRGRPYALVSRAFRDTVRVWGSGSIATKVALTTTATASVAGAAVAPSLIDRDTKYDIFVVDSASAAFYRIDLQTDVSVRAPRETEALSPVAIATTSTPVTTRDGKKLLKGSMIVIVAANGGGVQGIVGLGPGGAAPVSISRIEPAIPGAWFTGAPCSQMARSGRWTSAAVRRRKSANSPSRRAHSPMSTLRSRWSWSLAPVSRGSNRRLGRCWPSPPKRSRPGSGSAASPMGRRTSSSSRSRGSRTSWLRGRNRGQRHRWSPSGSLHRARAS